MAQNVTQYENYLRNGKEIFETYCSTEDKHPIMLPRAPQQTYIDLYPNEDQPGCSFKDDRQQQLNYEAEVKVYRALEKLGEDLIVLHSFEYTHFQYHLGDSSHDKRECAKCKNMAANREGECDFVVIASNYFVIIEVKNMGHIGELSDPGCNKDQQLRALANTFQKSLQQRKKVVELIKRFCRRLTVLQFTVYPNFEGAFKSEFQLSRDQKSTIIFKEDIDDFSTWWKDNVSDLVLDEPLRPEFRAKQEEVRNLLLAMWCTEKNTCNMTKCSLGRCILDIDEQLRSGRFTFRSNNPEVIPTPTIVKDFLGVDNLTKQQYDLINSTEKFLWINGPAGAGKTIVLMAKMLQLVLSSEDNKVVFFNLTDITADIPSSERLHVTLENAGVKHVPMAVKRVPDEPSELYCEIANHLLDYQVVIITLSAVDGKFNLQTVEPLKNLLGLLQGINVFFDDIQALLRWAEGGPVQCVEVLFELSRSHHVWVACDIIQRLHYNSLENSGNFSVSFLNDKLSSSQLVSLSKNLRNTSDLSSTLSVIRNQIIELEHLYRSGFINDFVPLQAPGHYIHGPKVVIHVLQNFNKELIYDIFTKELCKLFSDNMIDKNEIGFVYCIPDIDTISLVKDIVHGILLSKDILIPRLLGSTYSTEWPAVIVLQTLVDNLIETMMEVNSGGTDLKNLYLAMSRARVKCTVIMYPVEGMIFDDFHNMKDLLDKLEDSVEIRRYPLTPPSYTPRSFPEPLSTDYFKEKFSLSQSFIKYCMENLKRQETIGN